MEPENNIGELFKNTLKDYRIESDRDLWSEIDSRLSNPEKNKKNVSFKNKFWLKIAASVLIFAGASFAYTLFFVPVEISEIIPQNFLNFNKKNYKPAENIVFNDTLNNNPPEYIDPKVTTEIVVDKKPPLIFNTENNRIVKREDTVILKHKTVDSSSYIKNSDESAIKVKENNETDLSKEPLFNSNNNQATSYYNNFNGEKVISDEKESIDIDIEIPNIFTPNGDGYNDYFVIKNIGNYQNQLLITDRNGKVVYEKVNYQNDWDGRNLPNGVYFFVLKCKYKNQDFIKTGSVSIFR